MAPDTERFEDATYLCLGGAETYLLFQQGFPLRDFGAFELFDDPEAYARFTRNFLAPIARHARDCGLGLVMDALVWRASRDHTEPLGYRPSDTERLNARAVATVRRTMAELAEKGEAPERVVLAGDLGPRGDGYRANGGHAAREQDYHSEQLEALARSGVDLVTALTMTEVAEAVGVVRASAALGLPVVVSATVETDGVLPDGTPLGEFVRSVDEATCGAPLFYMVNCAHPNHLYPSLRRARAEGAEWLERFRGFRANASSKSHAELDESPTLDRGDPEALARQIAAMHSDFDLRFVGGCCGTDATHVGAIARSLSRGAKRAAAA